MFISLLTKRLHKPQLLSTNLRRWISTEHEITNEDLIHKVDLRVGQIVEINNHPEAVHLYIEKVNVSSDSEEPRTIVSGLVPFMSKETLQNRKVIVVANLKASKFRGVLSQGMLLAASLGNTVETLSPPAEVSLGERVQLKGYTLGDAPDVLKPKQKIFEQVAQHLKTNEDGIATYKGVPLITSQGPVVSSIKSGEIS